MSTLKNQGSTIVLVLFLACLTYAALIFWGSSGEWINYFLSVSPHGIIGVVLLVSLGYILRFLRWDFYLRTMGYVVPVKPNLRIFMASYLMSISPGKVGQAAKSYFMKKEFNVPATPTIAAFFCERFTDLIALSFLAASGLIIYPWGGWLFSIIVFLEIGVVTILQFPTLIEQWIFQPFAGFRCLEKLINRARRFYEQSSKLLSFYNLCIGTFLGLFSWILEGISLFLIVRQFGHDSLSFTIAIYVFSASILLGTAAMLPGGIGGSEALMIGMLIYFDTTRQVAVASTVLIRLLTLWLGVAVGAICWIWTWKKLENLTD